MSFNLGSLMPALRKGLDLVNTILPIATAAGAPTGLINTATKIASALLETGQNITERVAEGKVVATATDQDELKSIVASIRAKNDELMEYIAAH